MRAFLVAAEEQSISRAARRLFVTQPAVSRLIRDMESQLGTKLFHRERRGLALTASGELLLPYARKILILYDEALQATAHESNAETTVNIGFIPASLDSFTAPMLRRLKEQCPWLQVQIHGMPPGEQIRSLRKSRIDLALVGTPCGTVMDEFETMVLRELPQRLILPSGHRLADQERVRLAEFRQDDFIGLSEDDFPGRNQMMQRACLRAGFAPKIVTQAGGLMSLLGMVGAGVGVGIVPSEVDSLPHPGVVFRQLADAVDAERFSVVWRRFDTSDAVRAVISALQGMREARMASEVPGRSEPQEDGRA